VVLLDLRVFDSLTLLFDIAFVVVCTAAALAVRPRDFFLVGVLPPLLMAATIAVVALMSRAAIADPGDGLLQTLVSGLAHHAGALVTGYALTLAVLALRQVALRNAGKIRALGRSRTASAQPPGRRPERRPEPRIEQTSRQGLGPTAGQPGADVAEAMPADSSTRPAAHADGESDRETAPTRSTARSSR
jgi:hypothetical protein